MSKQARRCLAPDGGIVIADLCEHGQEWVRDHCGDIWLGFEARAIDSWLARAGFARTSQQYLAQKNGFVVQVVSATSSNDH